MISPPRLHARLGLLGYSREDAEKLAPLIDRVNGLKARRRAVILVHNYERPEIYEVADALGDSLGLSIQAAKVRGDVIVFAGVRFMAETAKILNPGRRVLLPRADAGCSLAECITGASLAARIDELKPRYPDLAVVSYVNAGADVKALSEACCTSANAAEVVAAMESRHILFVPDRNLAAYVGKLTDKVIIPWEGSCHVHDQVSAAAVREAAAAHPLASVLVHPECRPEVLELADAVLSTEGMQRYAEKSESREFLIVTERGMADRLALEMPDKKFIRLSMECPFMKATRLEDVAASLEEMREEVTVPEGIRAAALKAVERMLSITGDREGQGNGHG